MQREPGKLTPGGGYAVDPKYLGELCEKLKIRITELSGEHAVGTMPVAGNRQYFGVMHGGAFVALGETLGSMAAIAHAGDDGYAVGLDVYATHTRAVSEGMVTGTCTALHLGRSLAVHEIVIRDEAGNRLSTVRITNFIKRRKPQRG